MDYVLLESKDVIKDVDIFLDGTHDCYNGFENKNWIKNNYYQLMGGSCVATLRNHTIDCFSLVQARASKDPITQKIFTSDKKAKSIFSFKKPEKIKDALMKGKEVSK